MKRSTARLLIATTLLLGAGSVGCGGAPGLRAAEAGQFTELRKALQQGLRDGLVDRSDARSVALAVAVHEVEHAATPAGGARLRELESCARHLAEPLRRRASGRDAMAPLAAMVLVEAGLYDARELADSMTASARDELPTSVAESWRAVRTRGLVRPEDATLRRERVRDADEEVRLAALRASHDAGGPEDVAVLLEAARLDPHPLARVLAVRALRAVGGEATVRGLADLYPQADEPTRLSIVDAWGAPLLFEVGGRRELGGILEKARGPAAIAAARPLLRAGGGEAQAALGVLVRAIASGAPRERQMAIRTAPLSDAGARKAILAASSDADLDVAIAAMSRRLEALGGESPTDAERKELVARLRPLAAGTSARALMARGALVQIDAPVARALLLRDVASKDERLRKAAGTGLASLGELGHASLLTADTDPRVRTTVACAILRAR